MNATASYYHQKEYRSNSSLEEWSEKIRSDKNRLLDEMRDGKKIKEIDICRYARFKAIKSMTTAERAEYEFLCDRNKNNRTVSKERFLELMKGITK